MKNTLFVHDYEFLTHSGLGPGAGALEALMVLCASVRA